MFTLSIEQHLVDTDYREQQLAAGTHLLDPDVVTEEHDTLAAAWARVVAIAEEFGTVANLYDTTNEGIYVRLDGPEEGETQGYAIIYRRPASMRTRDALQTILHTTPAVDTPRWQQAVAVVRAIIAQRGCEHFDPAVDDGHLTTLMDIVMYG